MSDAALSPHERAPDAVVQALANTSARVLVGRAGPAYRTETWLKLRQDHAAARDAVRAEIDLSADFGAERVGRLQLFEVRTQATSKSEYLRRPDLGRRLAKESREELLSRCSQGIDFQIVIGDGLSATATAGQAPGLLDDLHAAASALGWSVGKPFLIRYCRVGVMNEIGDLLKPTVMVLLIGERPGLATAESLSAYLAYQPRAGQTDADRNLISNIHSRGVYLPEATGRILALTHRFRTLGRSGFEVKEEFALPGLTGEQHVPLAAGD